MRKTPEEVYQLLADRCADETIAVYRPEDYPIVIQLIRDNRDSFCEALSAFLLKYGSFTDEVAAILRQSVIVREHGQLVTDVTDLVAKKLKAKIRQNPPPKRPTP